MLKVLIPYDGSSCSADAIADLKRSGLPESGVEAVVLTVAEFDTSASITDYPQFSTYTPTQLADQADRVNADAIGVAEAGRLNVQSAFPQWTVRAETAMETPYWSIIHKAQEWKADLIVVGTHGRSVLERLMIGSVSKKTLLYADCSVRLGKCAHTATTATPHDGVRILLAWDGSSDAELAADTILHRTWPANSECRVVIALDYQLVRRLPDGINDVINRARVKTEQFRAIGLASPEPLALEGDPKRVLLDEATKWNADNIFIGTKGQSQIARVLLGSVSTAIATRAPCSVEVVRARQPSA